jgi:undecaprenyl-diphosphatase
MNESLNLQLFALINASSHANCVIVSLATVLANGLFYGLVAFLAVYWLTGKDEAKRLVLKSFCLSLIALGIAQIITHLYPHPRPFMIGVGNTLINHPADASFPSDHLTVFSCVAMAFLLGKKHSIGTAIFVLGWVVAWARVYLGVHFPFDMLGAATLSIGLSLLFEPIWRHWGKTFSQPFLTVYQWGLMKFSLS